MTRIPNLSFAFTTGIIRSKYECSALVYASATPDILNKLNPIHHSQQELFAFLQSLASPLAIEPHWL